MTYKLEKDKYKFKKSLTTKYEKQTHLVSNVNVVQ